MDSATEGRRILFFTFAGEISVERGGGGGGGVVGVMGYVVAQQTRKFYVSYIYTLQEGGV